MKKRFTLILASMLLTMGAWAQTLNFTFTRTEQDATVNVDGATGVTATIAISPANSNYLIKNKTAGDNNPILCINQNTNVATESSPNSYTLTITNGSTQALSFDHILVSGVALNSEGAYQSASTVRNRYFKVTCGSTSLLAEKLCISDDKHCNGTPTRHPFVAGINIPAGETYIIKVDIYTDGGQGCFYGLTSIVLGNYATLVAEAQAIYDVHGANKGNLGYYSTATVNALETAKAKNEVNKTNINNLLNAIDNLELVVPTPGKFYRLQGKASGWYASASENNSKMALVEDKEADPTATVFYLTENNKLLSFKLGTFLKETHSIGAVGEANGNAISFNPSESGNAGYFTLKTNYSGSKYIYDDKADSEVDRNGNYAANNCEWIVEEVTYLPVPVSNTLKFGTLYSPVALSLTEQWSTGKIKAYTGAVKGEYLELTEIEGDIPANTPVVIEHIGGDYKNGCAFLKIIETAEAVSAENALSGTLADEYITPAANENAYVLANKDGVVGFYKAKINVNTDTSNDITEGEGDDAVTTPVPESFLNNGFKAYLSIVTVAGGTESAQAIRIRKAGDEETTSIEPSTINPQLSTPIYDLQGRRVEKMEKGIYIVNGKKVIR